MKQGTAPDRIPSVSDPEQRHGHKRFTGHRVAVVVDRESQLILDCALLLGNAGDAQWVLEAIERVEETTGRRWSKWLGTEPTAAEPPGRPSRMQCESWSSERPGRADREVTSPRVPFGWTWRRSPSLARRARPLEPSPGTGTEAAFTSSGQCAGTVL
jgi:hypothetical protein